MQTYQEKFIEFAISSGALRFGHFILKSGRISPYFFNIGLFNSGKSLRLLGQYYADALENSTLNCDMLYGPAYKGIPLACTTAIALSERYGKDYPYAFNRKEVKGHGEGGLIVGAPLQGQVLIIDDVITAGTSIRESVNVIRQTGASPCGTLIALDRQEKMADGQIATNVIEQEWSLKIESIVTMDDVLDFLQDNRGFQEEVNTIRAYRDQFGA